MEDVAKKNVFKRKREKSSKGLRHFSMKVCEKVKEKGTTTYNQVADELVNEYCVYTSSGNAEATSSSSIDYWTYDQKNVRRRVYDALNVLMAMNIISKEKKEIKWIGLPSNKKQECHELDNEKKKRQERISEKSDILKSLLLEQILIRSLVERNSANNKPENSNTNKIQLPFILLNTDAKTVVDCSISNNRKEYLVQLDDTFRISSHLDVLRNIKLINDFEANNTQVNQICALLPKIYEPYVKQLVTTNNIEPICFLPWIPTFLLPGETPQDSKTSKMDKNGSNSVKTNEKESEKAKIVNKNSENKTTPSEVASANVSNNDDYEDENSFENYEEEDFFEEEDEEDEEEEEEEEEDEDDEQESLPESMSQ